MNTELFSDAMSELNEKYIMEAATFQRKAKSTFQIWMSRAACFFLAVILTGSAVLTFSVEARAAFFGWVRQQYETFYEYFFEGEPEITEPLRYSLGWLPEGCEFVTSYEIPGGEVYAYADEQDMILQFTYGTAPDTQSLFIDTVDYTKKPISVNGISGEVFIAPTANETNCIIWTDNAQNTIFYVSGACDEDTLIRIAESIKIKE